MKLNEMHACVAETLAYFIASMQDVPFSPEDIVIEFVKKANMAKRARELCALYVLDKIINDTQAQQFVTSIAANALIGREKSAVIAKADYKLNKQELRMILFHELTHIYCAKLEMDDGEHFVGLIANSR